MLHRLRLRRLCRKLLEHMAQPARPLGEWLEQLGDGRLLAHLAAPRRRVAAGRVAPREA